MGPGREWLESRWNKGNPRVRWYLVILSAAQLSTGPTRRPWEELGNGGRIEEQTWLQEPSRYLEGGKYEKERANLTRRQVNACRICARIKGTEAMFGFGNWNLRCLCKLTT